MGASANQERGIAMIYLMNGMSAEWVREMVKNGTPVRVDAIYFEHSTTELATDDYTAYDRGDLCSEIDRALGDMLERVINRYMPGDLARDVRHQICGDLADIVIDYDKSNGDPAKEKAV